MHGKIPGDYPQTIADLSHGVKFKGCSYSKKKRDVAGITPSSVTRELLSLVASGS